MKKKIKITDDEKKHVVNLIILSLPKEGDEWASEFFDVRGASSLESMGLEKPRFGTVGAGSIQGNDKSEIVGRLTRFKVCGGVTKVRSYAPKRFLAVIDYDSYNSLIAQLTDDELSLLNQCRGIKRLWRRDSDRFSAVSPPKSVCDSLSDKIFYACLNRRVNIKSENN